MTAHLLLAIAVVVVAARAAGSFAEHFGQPRVMGEITAGILLGPSLLGAVWPEAGDYLFPPEVVQALSAIGQLGLVLFMFLIGVEMNPGHLRNQGHRVVVSHTSIVVPMALGIGLAIWLHPELGGDAGRFEFALFIGAAMAITAFPVLARILTDVGLEDTRIGVLAMSCAAVDDVTAWCVLAGVVAVVKSTGPADVALTVLWSVLFIVTMLKVVGPWLARRGGMTLPAAVAFALAAAWLTEMIGIHAIFGAFLAGAITPERRDGEDALSIGLGAVTRTILLPAFFVTVGLSAQVTLLNSAFLWAITVVIILVAIVGKLGGSTIAARLTGETWTDALRLGILMNTRGLTEIVILTVGLELGVIDTRVFSMMLLMALCTTFMAWPLLRATGVQRPVRTRHTSLRSPVDPV